MKNLINLKCFNFLKSIMKKYIKENWFKIAIVIIIAGLFYWYEWRPSEIKKECHSYATNKSSLSMNYISAYDNAYKQCLRKNGL